MEIISMTHPIDWKFGELHCCTNVYETDEEIAYSFLADKVTGHFITLKWKPSPELPKYGEDTHIIMMELMGKYYPEEML